MNPKLLDIPIHYSSERLLYRSYTPEDFEFYYQMLKDNWDHLYEFMPTDLMPVKSKEDVALVFQKHQKQWDAKKLFLYGISEKATKVYAGETYLANPDWDVPRIEIGYFMVKDHTGKGFATEAAKATTGLAFEKLHVSRVEMEIKVDNLASIRVAEKCGFTLEGRLRNRERKKSGELIDTFLFGMLLSEWKKSLGD